MLAGLLDFAKNRDPILLKASVAVSLALCRTWCCLLAAYLHNYPSRLFILVVLAGLGSQETTFASHPRPSRAGSPRLQVVVIPGNPGSAIYFQPFMRNIYDMLGGKLSIGQA